MKPADLRVMIGMPCYGQMPPETAGSLAMLLQSASEAGIHMELGMQARCGIVTKARSLVLHQFLQSDCNRLFWIDADMQWTPSQAGKILSLSLDHDIVGAAYPAKIDFPTYYICMDKDEPLRIDASGCIEVKGVGLGFSVITREVAEKVASRRPWLYDEIGKTFIRDVFRLDTVYSETVGSADMPGCPPELIGQRLPVLMGEDIAFFADCRAAGYQVWIYPDVDLGHLGSKVYRGDLLPVLGLSRLTETERETHATSA